MIANMPKQHLKKPKKPPAQKQRFFERLGGLFTRVWRKNVWNKILIVLTTVVFVTVGVMYGIAQWYIFSQRNVPTQLGVTFIPRYASYLGVEPKQTLNAILTDLQPTHVRLVSYWNDIEKTPGVYDFSQLDWQFNMVEQAGSKVTLAIGLRQPRWPECHMPTWQIGQPMKQWYPDLQRFMTATIEHYRDNPVLESYQLENEFFLSVFGECPDFSRDRLVNEFDLVKSLDPDTPVIISRSNNAIGFPINDPTPDKFGVSVYKRVWDRTITRRYIEYPFPAWFYGFLAGGGEILTGKDLMIHELQAEAWTPDGYDIKTAPLEELYKSMNPERLADRFQYGRATGMKRIDLWGAEWWYAMKVNRNEPGLWDTAIQQYQLARDHNNNLN